MRFHKEEDGCWYVVLPNWYLSHSNLMMVAGADDLCEELSHNGTDVDVDVALEPTDNYDVVLHRESWNVHGATYKVDGANTKQIWLCPVTLFVFNKYPKTMYLHVNNL